jgi:hypothetical protein
MREILADDEEEAPPLPPLVDEDVPVVPTNLWYPADGACSIS